MPAPSREAEVTRKARDMNPIRTPAEAKRALLRMRDAERLVARAMANMHAGRDIHRSERRLARYSDVADKTAAELVAWIDNL